MLGRRFTLACLVAAVAALVAVSVQAFVPAAPLPLSSGVRPASTRREVVVMGNHRSSQAARRRTSFLRHINAPLHKRRTIMSSPLSKELRAEHGGVRSIPVRTGDEVVVTAGDHRKKAGKVIGVDRKKMKIHVEGITREKAGAKEAGKTSTTIPIPLDPSKVRITKLQLDDSRKAILARRAAGRKMLAERKASVKLAEPGSDPAWAEYQGTLKGILDGSA